jgi:hypothetical protein
MLKLKSLAGRLTPSKDVTKVMGFIQMASSILTVGAVYSLSNVFDIFVDANDIPTSTAFVVLNMALGTVAVSIIVLRSFLKRSMNENFRQSFKSDKKQTAKEWEKLSKNLARIGIDSYETVKVKGEADQSRPTVAILAPPSAHKLPIIQEGGRQSAGDVHLVFDAGWLIQEELPDGKTHLYMKKGLTIDAEGKAVISEYETPRRVRYFANYFTEGANERTDGIPYEKNLDTPQSSSLQLEKTTNDKLLTRIWMAAKGVAVPATMALLMSAHPLKENAAAENTSENGVTITSLPAADTADRREEIYASVETFLTSNASALGNEVVVKPSGSQWHSSKGVEFFTTTDVEAIVDHILSLEQDPDMTADGSILIDQRVVSPALYYRSTPVKDAADKNAHDTWGNRVDGDVGIDFLTSSEIAADTTKATKKDFNLGVYAMRTPWGRAKATDIMVRAGSWGKPTVSEPGGPNSDWREHLDDAATIFPYEKVIEAIQKQHGLLKTA